MLKVVLIRKIEKEIKILFDELIFMYILMNAKNSLFVFSFRLFLFSTP